MEKIVQAVVDFTTLAIQAGGWMEMDRWYLQNRIAALLEVEMPTDFQVHPVTEASSAVLAILLSYKKEQAAEMTEQELQNLKVQLLDFLTPPPSVINAFFAQYYAKDPLKATDYFYHLARNSQIIQTEQNQTNQTFQVVTQYGELTLLQDYAGVKEQLEHQNEEQQVKASRGPQCSLCMENEGYQGNNHYSAQINQRLIRMNLNGESWFFKYSPYEYYQEQAFITTEKHQALTFSEQVYEQLLQLATILPQYWIGVSAQTVNNGEHAHYECGAFTFPLMKAKVKKEFALTDAPNIQAELLDWYVPAIRLKGENEQALTKVVKDIFAHYQVKYETDSQGISAWVKKNNDCFEIYLLFGLEQVIETSELHWLSLDLVSASGLIVMPNEVVQKISAIKSYLLQQATATVLSPAEKSWLDSLDFDEELTEQNVETQIRTAFIRKTCQEFAAQRLFADEQELQHFLLEIQ